MAQDNRHTHAFRDTIEVWQPYFERELTAEDGREIRENVSGLFSLLLEWATEEAQEYNGSTDAEPASGPGRSQ